MENRNSQGFGQNGLNLRIPKLDPWASYIGGGALTAFGISRKSLSGAALAAAGGYLVYRAVRNQRSPRRVHVQRSVTIMRPVNQVFSYWRNLENLPNIMTHLESVRPTQGRYSHWVARGPANTRVEWDAEIIDEKQDQFIVWRSCAGSDIENRGSVQFNSALNGDATELSIALDYEPPAGAVGVKLAQLFGRNPEQQVREDLRAFKALLEAGEIPTIDGQPHGRRSALVRAAQVAYPGHRREATNVKAIQPVAEQLA